VFFSDYFFTIAADYSLGMLGIPNIDNAASEIVADEEYTAPAVYSAPVGSEVVVTLVVNDDNGDNWGEITFTVEVGMELQDLVDLLNDELDDSILNDFRVISESGYLVFTNAYDFQMDESSTNVAALGMTDVVGGTVISIPGPSTYEVRAVHSLFGDVLDTGGYIAAKDTITLGNVDTAEHPYIGPDIGVRIEGSSEITTYEDYSSVEVDSKYDAEIEGHIIAGGEVENIRDAETGGYIGSVYHDFGTDAAHTEIIITAEHQVRIGTMIKAGGLIQLTGGEDPFEGDPDDIFNFSGASILIYGSALVETWGENSRIILDGPSEIKVMTSTHFEEIEPDLWVKGEMARIVAEGQFMLQGWLPVEVVLHMWKRDEMGEHEEYITIPSIGWGDDDGLLWWIQTIVSGSTHFSDIEVEQEGRYLMFTGYGYDFAILADGSENIDLLGLAPVISSTIYYPDAELIADEALPATGQLIVDVTLDITITDPLGITTTDSVIISASSTNDNTTHEDLIDDINDALDTTEVALATPFAPIEAVLSDDKVMFTSLGYEFEILDTSEHLNLLGFRGDWETTEYRELSELVASGAVPTTGQLVRDVVLVIRIEETDLDDVLLDAVTISAADTDDNTGIADLVDDINDAFADHDIWRYSEELYFSDYLIAAEQDGTLLILGTHDFKIKSASQNVSLLGMTPEEDLVAEPSYFDVYLIAEAAPPSVVLTDAVTLDLEINRGGEPASYSIVIPVDGTNATLEDLVEDINTKFTQAGADDLIIFIDEAWLGIQGLYDFRILATSVNAGLLGLSTVAAGYNVAGLRIPEADSVADVVANDLFDALIAADDNLASEVLDGSVTLDITIDREGVPTSGSVVIAVDETNESYDDLLEDINEALGIAGFSDISAELNGRRLVLRSIYDFTLEATSSSADNLSFNRVAVGFNVDSIRRDYFVYELVPERPLPTDGILAEEVTLEIVTTDSDDNTLTALVTVEVEDTNGTGAGVEDFYAVISAEDRPLL